MGVHYIALSAFLYFWNFYKEKPVRGFSLARTLNWSCWLERVRAGSDRELIGLQQCGDWHGGWSQVRRMLHNSSGRWHEWVKLGMDMVPPLSLPYFLGSFASGFWVASVYRRNWWSLGWRMERRNLSNSPPPPLSTSSDLFNTGCAPSMVQLPWESPSLDGANSHLALDSGNRFVPPN